MDDILKSFPRPHVPYCVRVTLGFYDAVNGSFVSTIPEDMFRTDGIRGVRMETPIVTPFDGFVKYVRVDHSMWDLRVDFVAPTKQAVFVQNRGVVGIANESFVNHMTRALEEVIRTRPETFAHESGHDSFDYVVLRA